MAKLFPFWWLNPVVTCDTVKACLEGDYTTWTKITDAVLDIIDQTSNVFAGLLYIDHANEKIILDDRNNARLLSCDFDGGNYTLLASGGSYRGGVSGNYFSEVKGTPITSIFGKYAVVLDTSAGDVFVLKNGQIAQTILWEPTSYAYTQNVAISSNGQYIVLICTNANGKRFRLIIYEGS